MTPTVELKDKARTAMTAAALCDVVPVADRRARAERDGPRNRRGSVLVVVAKARVWASEGMHVEIIDANGKTSHQPTLQAFFSGGLHVCCRQPQLALLSNQRPYKSHTMTR